MLIATKPGNLYKTNGVVFVAEGSQHNGKSVYARILKNFLGRTYVSVLKARRLIYNEGIVAVSSPALRPESPTARRT